MIPIHPAPTAVSVTMPGSLRLQGLPPLSLYVHLPWCIKKCPYCDFNSHEPRAGSTVDEAGYIAALMADLEAALPSIWGRVVHSIFIGGGTPSLFSPESIDSLVAGLRARLRLAGDCEVTMEANPGTFERERFAAFAAAGVTRLSIGVQSFSNTHLQALGRVHDRAQALAAVEEAARSFATFNLDLMYALPGQSLADLKADLHTALGFAPPHLSVYHLTIEPNTVFASRPPDGLPEDDSAYDMLDAITEATAKAGMARYEVSAFSKPGHQCRHNLNYWRFGDYLGIGAGAHSKISTATQITRQVRLRDPRRYLQAAASGESVVSLSNAIASADLPLEFMMNALRLVDGFELSSYCDRTGQSITTIRKALDAAESKGLLEQSLTWAKPTARGMDFLNDLQAMFLPG